MLVEIKCSAHLKKCATNWLKENYELIHCLNTAYQIVTSDPASWVTEDYAAMGVPAAECLVYRLEEVLCGLNLSSSYASMDRGTFGEGIAVQKYLDAFTAVDAILLQMKLKADYAEPFTDEEISGLKDEISVALGDLIYSFSRVLFSRNPREILVSPEDFTYSQDITAFLADVKKSAEDVARELIALQVRYVSVIPLFENDVAGWLAITKSLDASLVDILVDYGEYITSLDVRAIRAGFMLVDESFVDLIRERAENSMHIANQAPDKWNRFIQMIPDNEVEFFIAHESSMTPELLTGALEVGKIEDGYMDALYTLFGEKRRASETDVFGSK